RRTRWANLDEVLRGVGTVAVSVGMLLLLKGIGGGAGESLLLASLIAFILAFALGRERPPSGDAHSEPPDSSPPPTA
nr:hypothetical protein [Gemmatimonadales bacterium]